MADVHNLVLKDTKGSLLLFHQVSQLPDNKTVHLNDLNLNDILIELNF